MVQLYGDERMIEVPSGFGSRLQHRLAQSRRAPARSWSPWSAWLVPVAALLLITGGVRIASSRTVPQPLLSAHAQPARKIPPDMLVVVSAGAKEFHVPGCEFIHNKDRERTLTAKEAVQQGYVPCVRCMRKYLQTRERGPDLAAKWKQPRNQTLPALNRMAESKRIDPELAQRKRKSPARVRQNRRSGRGRLVAA